MERFDNSSDEGLRYFALLVVEVPLFDGGDVPRRDVRVRLGPPSNLCLVRDWNPLKMLLRGHANDDTFDVRERV